MRELSASPTFVRTATESFGDYFSVPNRIYIVQKRVEFRSYWIECAFWTGSKWLWWITMKYYKLNSTDRWFLRSGIGRVSNVVLWNVESFVYTVSINLCRKNYIMTYKQINKWKKSFDIIHCVLFIFLFEYMRFVVRKCKRGNSSCWIRSTKFLWLHIIYDKKVN